MGITVSGPTSTARTYNSTEDKIWFSVGVLGGDLFYKNFIDSKQTLDIPRSSNIDNFKVTIYAPGGYVTPVQCFNVGNGSIRVGKNQYGQYILSDNLEIDNGVYTAISCFLTSEANSSPSSQTGQSQFHLSASMGLILLLILLAIFLAFKRQG